MTVIASPAELWQVAEKVTVSLSTFSEKLIGFSHGSRMEIALETADSAVDDLKYLEKSTSAAQLGTADARIIAAQITTPWKGLEIGFIVVSMIRELFNLKLLEAAPIEGMHIA